MSDKIKIYLIEGGSNGDKLKGCYFVPRGDTFDFYDKKVGNTDEPLKTGITSESSFQFELPNYPDLPWKIYVKSITDEKADGDWYAGLQKLGGAGDDEGSGTFQAQAGGATVAEETASSATA